MSDVRAHDHSSLIAAKAGGVVTDQPFGRSAFESQVAGLFDNAVAGAAPSAGLAASIRSRIEAPDVVAALGTVDAIAAPPLLRQRVASAVRCRRPRPGTAPAVAPARAEPARGRRRGPRRRGGAHDGRAVRGDRRGRRRREEQPTAPGCDDGSDDGGDDGGVLAPLPTSGPPVPPTSTSSTSSTTSSSSTTSTTVPRVTIPGPHR